MSNSLWQAVLLFIWALGCIVLLGVIKLDRIKLFDPNEQLAEQAANFMFDKKLLDVLASRGINSSSIVHFSAESPCYCNTLSQRFSEPLTNALGNKFNFHTVMIDAELKALIPSYPAIAVIDKENHLRYFGPYASGIGCFVGKGNIQNIVDITQSESFFGAVINSEVSGCYCST